MKSLTFIVKHTVVLYPEHVYCEKRKPDTIISPFIEMSLKFQVKEINFVPITSDHQ